MSYRKDPKVASATVLKTTIGVTVTEAGEIKREDKMKVFIEKAGQLRMFVETPPYVGVLLPQYQLDPKYKAAYVEWNPEHNRIYGRSPGPIEGALRDVLRAYSERKKSLVLEPKILVRFKGENHRGAGFDTGAFSYGSQQVELALSVTRLLFEPSTSKPTMLSTSRYSHGTFYKWREDMDAPLERTTTNGGGGKLRVFDYNDALWASLTSMRDAFADGVDRFAAFMGDDAFETKILNGQGPLQLTGPAE